MVKLGQMLFFSHTLSGIADVSCASCHHPAFGGADGLSLPVGIVPETPATVGPGRRVVPSHDLDPLAEGGPNMHRNSLSVYNSALYNRSLTYDGRIFVLGDSGSAGGAGEDIRTPETGTSPDLSEADNLLETMVKFPLVNESEMRGFQFTEVADPGPYREMLGHGVTGTGSGLELPLYPEFKIVNPESRQSHTSRPDPCGRRSSVSCAPSGTASIHGAGTLRATTRVDRRSRDHGHAVSGASSYRSSYPLFPA